MLHTNDYAYNCVIKFFWDKTPQVMPTYLVNYTSDIDGLPHLSKTIIVTNKMS